MLPISVYCLSGDECAETVIASAERSLWRFFDERGSCAAEFEAEIDALAEATDLPITPNYMGDPIRRNPTPGRGPSL
ncbi:hypothetical protein OIU34_23410 [Pararhizobium sp. BT-229]|uniref:hypothetical protein n=1 Tax=Pararhizobium sp. BT-229 TaxID=2986923 RepID=UPI0021F78F74|nr:hypothetical protein [Pararhizobium sp. BT-229]MCV9964845.1 hypothetical protein [Pararhizobium sp. BT-229]